MDKVTLKEGVIKRELGTTLFHIFKRKLIEKLMIASGVARLSELMELSCGLHSYTYIEF